MVWLAVGIVGFNQGLMVRSQERARAREEEEEEERKRAARIAARNNRYAALLADGVPPEEARAMLDVSITEYDPSGETSKGLPFGAAQDTITETIQDTDTTIAPPVVDSDRTSELLEQITDVITTPTGDEVIESATANIFGRFCTRKIRQGWRRVRKRTYGTCS